MAYGVFTTSEWHVAVAGCLCSAAWPDMCLWQAGMRWCAEAPGHKVLQSAAGCVQGLVFLPRTACGLTAADKSAEEMAVYT